MVVRSYSVGNTANFTNRFLGLGRELMLMHKRVVANV